ncbi:aminotransferase class IV [Aliiglaciecola litoralis]|uniref:D-amino acid aminotransferase n=1 Tax=Aliiglaciecola litoralis TaxID=582857 RepID=A0ABN1LCJ2_9ALTE
MANDTVYLNGQFLNKQKARISPLDRGFLFGDGIYEVIPCQAGKLIGFELHIQRLRAGLDSISISLDWSYQQWQDIIESLMKRNQAKDVSVYIQVSRGTDRIRQHGFSQDISPTIFVMCQAMASSAYLAAVDSPELQVMTQLDQRWRNCHIKATSLLANVLHFQHAQRLHVDETLLYNAQQQLTEGSTSNVFVVKKGRVFTPPLDNQILPGVTRAMLIDMLTKHTQIEVVQKPILLSDARTADEIWLTSSSKQVSAVVTLDGVAVGNGAKGKWCDIAQQLFDRLKFSY